MRITFIDGMRFIAAFAVLLQHYLEVVARDRFHWFLDLSPGVFGVALFFMISGYVIPFSVRNGLDPKSFFLRRAFRIFPLYWVILVVMMALGYAGYPQFHEAVTRLSDFDVLANFLLVFEYVGSPALLGVAWSLSIELIWYAFFAVYFLRYGHRNAYQANVVIALFSLLLSCASLLLEIRFPMGRLGMLQAALLGYAFCSMHLKEITPRQCGAAVAAFAISVAVSQIVSFGYFEHPNISLFNGLSGWFSAFTLFCCVCGIAKLRSLPVWEISWVLRLGATSYSVYLLHPVTFWLLEPFASGALLFFGAVALTLILSELAFQTIEMPGVRLGKRLSARKRAAVAPRDAQDSDRGI